MSMKVRKILATTIAAATMFSFAGCTINIDKDLAERIAGEFQEAVENGDIEIKSNDEDEDKDTDDSNDEEETAATTTEFVNEDAFEPEDIPNSTSNENTNTTSGNNDSEGYRDDADYYELVDAEVLNFVPGNDFWRISFSAHPISELGQPVVYTGFQDDSRATTNQIYPFFEGDDGIYIQCQTIEFYNAGDSFGITVYKDGELYYQGSYILNENSAEYDIAEFCICQQNEGYLEAGNYYIELTGYNGQTFANANVIVRVYR